MDTNFIEQPKATIQDMIQPEVLRKQPVPFYEAWEKNIRQHEDPKTISEDQILALHQFLELL